MYEEYLMTEERRLVLEEKLNHAEASGDPAEIAAVKRTMEQEYRLCTSHTADRLKRVENTVYEIKKGLIPHQLFEDIQSGLKDLNTSVGDLKSEVEGWKHKVQGAKMLWQILGYIAAAGGGGVLLNLLKQAQ